MKANTILKSSNIYIGKGNEILSGFVAIKNEKIIYVGSNNELENYIDNNTKIIDFKDKLIMPGIHDAHLHLFLSSLYADPKVKVSIDDRSEQECIAKLKDIEKLNGKDEWMIGAGWYHTLWDDPHLPSRYSLDDIYPDRPVCMISYDLHTCWLNTCGMKKLQIDENTKDIPGGTIDRDENGIPLGIFHEAAFAEVIKKIVAFDEEYIYGFYHNFIKQLNSNGITSVCDMSLSPTEGMDFVRDDILQKMLDNNELSVRVHMYPTMNDDVSRPLSMKEKYQGPMLFCNGVKQFFDGVNSCHTAWVSEPYTNAYFENDCGKPTINPKKMREYVFNAHKNNLSIRVHTIGDKAIHEMIDYIIEAQTKYGVKKNLQHTLEHLENLLQPDIERLANNNILLSVQPAHSVYDVQGVERDLGSERIEFMWPFNSELKAGCKLAFGTDSPVVGINPFYGIYNAITRKNTFTRLPENGWIKKEKITAFQAVSAYTYGSACACKAEDILGSLEVNKYADICVLDRNILKIDPEEIPDTKCLFTMLSGKIVYQK